MAAVPLTVQGSGYKVPRQTITTTEDAYTITGYQQGGDYTLLMRPTVDMLYHSTSGQTAADGFPVPGGTTLAIAIPSSVNGVTFYLRAATVTGSLDCLVL
jgi:hypothetical protein